jgi:sugar phosphate isomerase/epimerase
MAANARNFGRLAMNQATVPRWTAPQAIDGCARAGYRAVGLWRDRVQECGISVAARVARNAQMTISSLCRGGWFCAPDAAARLARLEDNKRAIEEAAELSAATLVLVCGPAASKDLGAGRSEVHDAIANLTEKARECGVTLGIEPMHPLYCADRSVVVTLAQALDMARSVDWSGEVVGLVLDSYHLWWDPSLDVGITEAAQRILAVQLADWLAPLPDALNGRGMLGDGSIDLRRFRELTESAGYSGAIEVEIFNPDVWALDPIETLEVVAQRYAAHVE